ncbi:MAG: hypothetical protein QOK48_1268, partial [Blastocatellia bacterium]|nr:hypothetical protein [Blastocatellia bacterium]
MANHLMRSHLAPAPPAVGLNQLQTSQQLSFVGFIGQYLLHRFLSSIKILGTR